MIKSLPNNFRSRRALQGLVIFALLAFSYYNANAQTYYTFSYTYQNITRIDGGGTLEVGDTIEIRALMKVDRRASNLYYRDTIQPGFELVPNSMKLVTNEGLLFRGTYTDGGGDDMGMVRSNGGLTRLRINIGSGAAAVTAGNFNNTTGGGTVNPGDKPRFYGTTLFVVAYQLVVTANFGDIVYPTGTFYYNDVNNVSRRERFDYAGIKVLINEGLCQNFSSASFTAESDFGRGTLQNRAAGVIAPGYVKYDLAPANPQDGRYSVATNTSGTGATDNSVNYRHSSRVFNVWDIVGDHTGATDPEMGNPPVAPGTEGGYMLVVNSAYPTGEAYSDVISGLCPNTYYEFSAWIRNICGYCGIDSNSVSTDLPGVKPNLAFTINDVDHYTTGEIPWTQKWVKRGFLYRTGPTETSFKITIKNNAAGGGGNDWVLDDIKLATCYPDLIMNPSEQVEVCAGALLYLQDTIRSFFNNYNYYCWEKSTDEGLTWTSTGNCGSKIPVRVNGMWEYIIDTVFVAQAVDSGMYLRAKVATTLSNMTDPNCTVENSQKLLMKVASLSCEVVSSSLKTFSATNERGRARTRWTSLNESDIKSYEVQRSRDGNIFVPVASIPARFLNGGDYEFSDPDPLDGSVFYRLKLVAKNQQGHGYSQVAALHHRSSTFTVTAANPFYSSIQFELASAEDGVVEVQLYDATGRQMKKQLLKVNRGANKLILGGVGHLQPGIYVFKTIMNGKATQQKLVKK